jgi:predicted  nucleic acid-binding Zn-ribbon protein
VTDATIAALRSDLAKLRAERDEARAAEVAALQAVDALTAEVKRLRRVIAADGSPCNDPEFA